ncbi:MAG: nucleotide pyrophosphohydrolase [Ignavibacteriaceae bacterium]|nr:nucleotide pyrophosphohydrolase [Ignavibacteriaceae bacterium]
MSKSISELTQIIVDFAEKRGWKNENPSHLLNAIYIELAELGEHYQWKNDFSKYETISEDEKTEIGFEFVDVIFYLFRLAHNSEINIEEYFDKKLPKLEEKYKVGTDYGKAHREYRESGKNKRYE